MPSCCHEVLSSRCADFAHEISKVLLASATLSAHREMDDEDRPARVTSEANMKNSIAVKNLKSSSDFGAGAPNRRENGETRVVLKSNQPILEPVQHVRFNNQ